MAWTASLVMLSIAQIRWDQPACIHRSDEFALHVARVGEVGASCIGIVPQHGRLRGDSMRELLAMEGVVHTHTAGTLGCRLPTAGCAV